VLYRIDGGIDHILVDEAQDTSPRQWDVIEKLTDEFHSGSGARTDVERTLFVVGDKKQSIYSFQGADPMEFDRKSIVFQEKIGAAGKVFQRRSLDYSFRSSSAILRMVDTVFDPRRRPDFDAQNQHVAFKDALPGRVDIWPLVEKPETEEDRDWTDPLDRRSPQHHTVILAEQVASHIKELTTGEHYIPDDGPNGSLVKRRIRPGDFLILVQRRSALFAELIRACKAKKLAIAGADRLKVGGELAVRDIAALLSFLATPDDSLSLATALKSPLFGWSEQQLFHLAHRRDTRNLWADLRNKDTEYPETVSILKDMRGQVDFLRPYDLIELILTRHDGRRKLLSRLGPEAEDGINAMLTQALAYERGSVPSLTGFIEWMQTDNLEIKRQIDSASNQIRVMTVHGSKGLEAPIVILPDTGKRDIVIKDEIITLKDVPLWKPSTPELPTSLHDVIDGMKDAQHAERLRLLYVAMTRAEKWLIIAAAGDLSKDNSAWYQIAEEAMGHNNAVEIGTSGIMRFEEGDWEGLPATVEKTETVATPLLDRCFAQTADVFSLASAVLTPSDLGGAKALQGDEGEDLETALSFGSLVHLLLQYLPGLEKAACQSMAQHLVQGFDADMSVRATAEATACLDAPNLRHIFDLGTLAEASLTGEVAGQRMHGIIDRLIIGPDSVLLIDYKTNRKAPDTPADCPEGILRQMGAYAALLTQIYPDHRIETAVLWTINATLMPLPHNIVTDALWRSPYLDATRQRS
jgi:ATP-dependent helicase/nuclease subunit A